MNELKAESERMHQYVTGERTIRFGMRDLVDMLDSHMMKLQAELDRLREYERAWKRLDQDDLGIEFVSKPEKYQVVDWTTYPPKTLATGNTQFEAIQKAMEADNG